MLQPVMPGTQVARDSSVAPARCKGSSLAHDFLTVRETSLRLCAPLDVEDHSLQSMPDASPAKWHLAHTTWFFETFVLSQYAEPYRPYHPAFRHLFNS